MSKIKEINDTESFNYGMSLVVKDPEAKEYNRLTNEEKHCFDLAAKSYFNELVKVKFGRHDGQAENYLPVKYKDKWVSWTGNLLSGGVYTLPRRVMYFLRNISTPIYRERETINHLQKKEKVLEIVGEEPRFSCYEVA